MAVTLLQAILSRVKKSCDILIMTETIVFTENNIAFVEFFFTNKYKQLFL